MVNKINEKVFNNILAIRQEFGYQSGRWAENEYLQSDIAIEEFNYIHNQCNQNNFQYQIDWEMLEDIANEYDEELISLSDIICEENPFSKGYFINKNINGDNYWQFDALASDIECQLINYLKKQLI